jgi:uncharacterized protein
MYFENAIIFDTSAVYALINTSDQYHKKAVEFYTCLPKDYTFVIINYTKYESYTRIRYDLDFYKAMNLYNCLCDTEKFFQIEVSINDENGAKQILTKYSDHKLSFHDAICANIMKKIGIFKIFSFDNHFNVLGFEVIP